MIIVTIVYYVSTIPSFILTSAFAIYWAFTKAEILIARDGTVVCLEILTPTDRFGGITRREDDNFERQMTTYQEMFEEELAD